MSERSEYSFSRRSLLSNADEKDIRSPDELAMVAKYKKLFQQLQEDQTMVQNIDSIVRQIYARNDPDYITIKRSLQDSTGLFSKRIDEIDRKLIELENAQFLMNVIHRERKKLEQLEHQLGESARQSYIERETKKQQELMQAYLSRTEERQSKKQLSSETAQTPIVETKNIVHTKNKNVYDVLSIYNLVFAAIFFIIALGSLIIADGQFFWGYIRGTETVDIHTYGFASFFMSMLSEAVSSVISVILLPHSSRKVINLVSLGISAGLLTFLGIMLFFAGV